jgi:hypothetical protein
LRVVAQSRLQRIDEHRRHITAGLVKDFLKVVGW